jgi:hypothetical protein
MSDKTLRLHFPQWQGGNIEAYHFGSQLLPMLAPASNGPVATVEVAEPAVSGRHDQRHDGYSAAPPAAPLL